MSPRNEQRLPRTLSKSTLFLNMVDHYVCDENSPPPFVSQADSDFIEISAKDDLPRAVRKLGFEEHRSSDTPVQSQPGTRKQFRLTVKDKHSKAAIFRSLTACGIPFSSGRDWSPEQVYADLAESYELPYPFNCIMWTDPRSWRIKSIERPQY